VATAEQQISCGAILKVWAVVAVALVVVLIPGCNADGQPSDLGRDRCARPGWVSDADRLRVLGRRLGVGRFL
jgi:hypothetical protein